MAEPRMEKLKVSPHVRRVFINNIDSYASKCIAQCLSERVAGQTETEEEEERVKTRAFHVVGTVSGKYDVDIPYVLEEYLQPNRDELLAKLMDCDVVIYNITQYAEQVDEALLAVSALHNEMGCFSGSKMFILVATVMTWACSKPVDPIVMEDVPFTDEIFWGRKAHPNFKPYIDLEKKVVKIGKTNRTLFSTYVVASGLQYGMGEHVFHYLFKITSSDEPDCLLLMQKIFDMVGQPRNYGLASQEVEEEERRKAEEKMSREAQEKAEERKEAEEAKHRAAHWEEWTKSLEEVMKQEEEVLEAKSLPMRNYLMEHVMPTLTQGLMECCTARPQDPVDFLAEFLMKNNPFNY
ncbi:adenylate kinase 7-like [Lycodopsis pacificus]